MKQIYQKYHQLIPVLVLACCCLVTIISFLHGRVETISSVRSDFPLTPQHYGAFAAVAVNFMVFFVFRPYFKYMLVFTLFFGLFNGINFIPVDVRFTFSIGVLKLVFQPLILVVVLLTYIINFKKANDYVIDHIIL